jgi:branched-chain amino acid transport system permease protein
VGQVYALGILVFPRLSLAFIYVLMALVLIIRPWGLLGRPLQR